MEELDEEIRQFMGNQGGHREETGANSDAEPSGQVPQPVPQAVSQPPVQQPPLLPVRSVIDA